MTNTGTLIRGGRRGFGYLVQAELRRRYDKGAFSLARRATCPLMWSHYGDQHKGICLGYSIPDAASGDVHEVPYGGSRIVDASDIAAMLGDDEAEAKAARRRVDRTVLLAKAKPWKYEREWRLLGPRGEQNSPLVLDEVVFGMRCPDSIKCMVVKALEKRDRPVQFYEIPEPHDGFVLKRRKLHKGNLGELLANCPRSSAQEDFEVIPDF